MKPDYQMQKNADRQAVIERAVKAGVKSARAHGKNVIQVETEEFGRLVDQRERFHDLLMCVLPILEDSPALPATIRDIKDALAGR